MQRLYSNTEIDTVDDKASKRCRETLITTSSSGNNNVSSILCPQIATIQGEEKKVEQENRIIKITDLKDILECGICREWFVDPYILACSHTHCYKCLMPWLRVNKSCPACRCLILKPASENKQVAEIVKMMVCSLQDNEEKMIYEQRCTESQDYFNKEYDHFVGIINKATENGTKFLNITRLWNEKEKRIFRIGLERYAGRELTKYCELTGLSKEYILEAKFLEIIIAARNLDCQIPTNSNGAVDVMTLRMILLEQIK